MCLKSEVYKFREPDRLPDLCISNSFKRSVPKCIRLVQQRALQIPFVSYTKEKAHWCFRYFLRHDSSVSKATDCTTGSVVRSRHSISLQTLERL